MKTTGTWQVLHKCGSNKENLALLIFVCFFAKIYAYYLFSPISLWNFFILCKIVVSGYFAFMIEHSLSLYLRVHL